MISFSNQCWYMCPLETPCVCQLLLTSRWFAMGQNYHYYYTTCTCIINILGIVDLFQLLFLFLLLLFLSRSVIRPLFCSPGPTCSNVGQHYPPDVNHYAVDIIKIGELIISYCTIQRIEAILPSRQPHLPNGARGKKLLNESGEIHYFLDHITLLN